VTHCACWAT